MEQTEQIEAFWYEHLSQFEDVQLMQALFKRTNPKGQVSHGMVLLHSV